MKATAAEKRKRNEIEAVEGYQAPQTVSDMLESDKEVLAQYYTMQTDVAEEIEKWKKSAEASKLTTQRQTIAGALGGVSLLRKIAQKKNYKLTALCHKPKQLLAALDEFCELCLQLGILPGKESLCMWLHTSIAGLSFIRNGNNSTFEQEVIDIIRDFENYIASVWVQYANLSTKPPVFSVFYLKSIFGYAEATAAASTVNVRVFSGDNYNAKLSQEKLVSDCNCIEVEAEAEDQRGGTAL